MATLATPGTLFVTAVSASHLQRLESVTNQDPYLSIEHEAVAARSITHWDSGAEPRWQEHDVAGAEVQLAVRGGSSAVLLVQVVNDNSRNKVRSKEDAVIGKATLDFSDAAAAPGSTCTRELALAPRGVLRLLVRFVAVGGQIPGATVSLDASALDELRRLVTQAQRQGVDVYQAFDHFDEDHSGTITAEELTAGMGKLGIPLSAEHARKLVRSYGDARHQVKIAEFMAMMTNETPEVAKQGLDATLAKLRHLVELARTRGVDLKQSFSHFDTDGDGKCTAREFREGLHLLGLEVSVREARWLIQRYGHKGAQGDELGVDYSEFLNAIGLAWDPTPPPGPEAIIPQLTELVRLARSRGIDYVGSFSQFDTRGDGTISRMELLRGLQLLGLAATENHVDYLLKRFGEGLRTSGGSIYYARFLSLVSGEPFGGAPPSTPRSPEPPQFGADVMERLRKLGESCKVEGIDLWAHFETYDRELRGVLPRYIFEEAVTSLGERLTDEELRRLTVRYEAAPGSYPISPKKTQPTDTSDSIDGNTRTKQERVLVRYRDLVAAMLDEDYDSDVADDDDNVDPDDVHGELQLIQVLQQLRSLVRLCRRDGKDYRELFESADKDYSGHIDLHEFRVALHDFGLEISSRDAVRLARRFAWSKTHKDSLRAYEQHQNVSGGDGLFRVDYREFLRLVRSESDELDRILDLLRAKVRRAGLSADDLQRTFEHFDQNLDGKIDGREFNAGLYELGLDVSKEQASTLMGRFINDDVLKSSRSASKRAKAGVSEERCVSYVEFVQLLLPTSEESRAKALREAGGPDDYGDRKLHALLEAVRQAVHTSKVSGVRYDEVWRRFDSCPPEEAGNNAGRTGVVTIHDFVSGLRALGLADELCNTQDVMRLMRRFQPGGHAYSATEGGATHVQYEQFVRMVEGGKESFVDRFGVVRRLRELVDRAQMEGQSLRQCFDDLDAKLDGVLDPYELMEGLQLLGVYVTEEEVVRVMQGCGLQKDGITFPDFLTVLGIDDPSARSKYGEHDPAYSLSGPLSDSENAEVDAVVEQLRKLCETAHERGVDYHEAFEHFDTDYSGYLDEFEFREGLRKLGFNVTDRIIACMLRRFALREPIKENVGGRVGTTGVRGNGRVSYRDFLRLITPAAGDVYGDEELEAVLHALRERVRRLVADQGNQAKASSADALGDAYKRVFEAFDTNGDGFVDRREFAAGLQALELRLSATQCRRLMRRFERPSDAPNGRLDPCGRIDYAAFVDMLRPLDEDLLSRLRKLARRYDRQAQQKPGTGKKSVSGGKDNLLELFERFDTDFSGAIDVHEFQSALASLGWIRPQSPVATDSVGSGKNRGGSRGIEASALTRLIARFASGRVKRTDERGSVALVSYRDFVRMLRAEPEEEKAAEREASKSSKLRAMGLPNPARETGALWKFLWSGKRSGLSDAQRSASEAEQLYANWKMRKEVYDRALLLLGKLDEWRADDNDQWQRVGTALCAVSTLLLMSGFKDPSMDTTRNRNGLKRAFLEWSKEKGHVFLDVEVGDDDKVKLLEDEDLDSGDEELDMIDALRWNPKAILPRAPNGMSFRARQTRANNRLYTKSCNKQWRSSEREIARRLVVRRIKARMELRNSYSARQSKDAFADPTKGANSVAESTRKAGEAVMTELADSTGEVVGSSLWSVLNGRGSGIFECGWDHSLGRGKIESCVLDLAKFKVNASGELSGRVQWKLIQSESGDTKDSRKEGQRLTELVRGSFNSSTRELIFKGHSTIPPNQFGVVLESYRLQLSEDFASLKGNLGVRKRSIKEPVGGAIETRVGDITIRRVESKRSVATGMAVVTRSGLDAAAVDAQQAAPNVENLCSDSEDDEDGDSWRLPTWAQERGLTVEREFLAAMGIEELLDMIRGDRAKRDKKKRDDAKEHLKEREGIHAKFVAHKKRFAFRMPMPRHAKGRRGKEWQPRGIITGGAKGVLDRSQTLTASKDQSDHHIRNRVARNSFELTRPHAELWTPKQAKSAISHASNKFDLKRSREAVLRKGYVFRENFRNEDGDIDEDAYRAALQSVGHCSDYGAVLPHNYKGGGGEPDGGALANRRKEGARRAFIAWASSKLAVEEAKRHVAMIERPVEIASVATRGFSPDMDREALWMQVGASLKAIDPKGLRAAWVHWSEGYATATRCADVWDTFPPCAIRTVKGNHAQKKARLNGVAEQWTWEHTRDLLLTILRKRSAPFGQAFRWLVEDKCKGERFDNAVSDLEEKISEHLRLENKILTLKQSSAGAENDQARQHFVQEIEYTQKNADKASEVIRSIAGSGTHELREAYDALRPDSEVEMHSRGEIIERAVISGHRKRMLRATKASDFRRYLRSLGFSFSPSDEKRLVQCFSSVTEKDAALPPIARPLRGKSDSPIRVDSQAMRGSFNVHVSRAKSLSNPRGSDTQDVYVVCSLLPWPKTFGRTTICRHSTEFTWGAEKNTIALRYPGRPPVGHDVLILFEVFESNPNVNYNGPMAHAALDPIDLLSSSGTSHIIELTLSSPSNANISLGALEVSVAFVRDSDDDTDTRIALDKLLQTLRRLVGSAVAAGVNLREAFEHFDTDFSDTLSFGELNAGFERLGIRKITQSEYTLLLKRFASSNSENCSNDVLKNLRDLIRTASSHGVDVVQAFEHFDTDRSGGISRDEFSLGLDRLNITLSDENLSTIVTTHANERGEILYQSFVEMLLSGERYSGSGFKSSLDPLKELKRLVRHALSQGVDIVKSFQHFDTDYSGGVSAEEFSGGLAKLNIPLQPDQIAEVMDAHGQNGEIKYEEFFDMLLSDEVPTASPENMTDPLANLRGLVCEAQGRGVNVSEAFQHFDRDHSGGIDTSEFRRGLTRLGIDMDEDNVQYIMSTYGKVGELHYADFVRMLLRDSSASLKCETDTELDYRDFVRIIAPRNGADFVTKDDAHNALTHQERELQELGEVLQRLRKLVGEAQRTGVSLEECFKHFDANNDGKINRSEFFQGTKALGFDLTHKQARILMRYFEDTPLGCIRYRNFVDFMLSDSKVTIAKQMSDAKKREPKVCMRTFLEIAGRRQRGSYPRCGWYVDARTDDGLAEPTIHERLAKGLGMVGAPLDFCRTIERRGDDAMRGLLFLTCASRQARIERARKVKRKHLARPPPPPVLQLVRREGASESMPADTTKAMLLEWKAGGATPETLFFTLEMVLSGLNKFKLICRDPPSSEESARLSYVVNNLKSNTRYEFRLVAFNRHGPSEPTRCEFTTVPARPSPPKCVHTVCAGSRASVTLAWGKSTPEIETLRGVMEQSENATKSISDIFESLASKAGKELVVVGEASRSAIQPVLSPGAIRSDAFYSWVLKYLKSLPFEFIEQQRHEGCSNDSGAGGNAAMIRARGVRAVYGDGFVPSRPSTSGQRNRRRTRRPKAQLYKEQTAAIVERFLRCAAKAVATREMVPRYNDQPNLRYPARNDTVATLEVTAFKATNLRIVQRDPYVRITLRPWGGNDQKARTKEHNNGGQNPTWGPHQDNMMVLKVPEAGRPVSGAPVLLDVEVLDAEAMLSDRVIGVGSIDLRHIIDAAHAADENTAPLAATSFERDYHISKVANEKHSVTVKLKHPSVKSDSSSCGELTLLLRFVTSDFELAERRRALVACDGLRIEEFERACVTVGLRPSEAQLAGAIAPGGKRRKTASNEDQHFAEFPHMVCLHSTRQRQRATKSATVPVAFAPPNSGTSMVDAAYAHRPSTAAGRVHVKTDFNLHGVPDRVNARRPDYIPEKATRPSTGGGKMKPLQREQGASEDRSKSFWGRVDLSSVGALGEMGSRRFAVAVRDTHISGKHCTGVEGTPWYELLIKVVDVSTVPGAATTAALPPHQGDIGVVVYSGLGTACTVTGLDPGSTYEFMLRSFNCDGEPSLVSIPLALNTRLTQPLPPTVRVESLLPSSVTLDWLKPPQNILKGSSASNSNDVLKDWTQTLRSWNSTEKKSSVRGVDSTDVECNFALRLCRMRRVGSGRKVAVLVREEEPVIIHRSGVAVNSCNLVELHPNTPYRAWIRVELKQRNSRKGDGNSLQTHSMWSRHLDFTTKPEMPSQPALVWATDTSAVLRWEPGNKGGAHRYMVELQLVEDGVSSASVVGDGMLQHSRIRVSEQRKWRPVWHGDGMLATLSGLSPESVYRVRVTALNAEGTGSSHGLPVQIETVSTKQAKVLCLKPSTAAAHFTVPMLKSCTTEDNDVVTGDAILYTESINTATGRLALRTVAARVVSVGKAGASAKRNGYALSVIWVSLSKRASTDATSGGRGPPHTEVAIKAGDLISRTKADLVSKFGVFRMRWAHESFRFGSPPVPLD